MFWYQTPTRHDNASLVYTTIAENVYQQQVPPTPGHFSNPNSIAVRASDVWHPTNVKNKQTTIDWENLLDIRTSKTIDSTQASTNEKSSIVEESESAYLPMISGAK